MVVVKRGHQATKALNVKVTDLVAINNQLKVDKENLTKAYDEAVRLKEVAEGEANALKQEVQELQDKLNLLVKLDEKKSESKNLQNVKHLLKKKLIKKTDRI